MKAIVIVFMPPRNGQVTPEPVLPFDPPDRWEDLAEWNGAKPGYRYRSLRGPVTPPFWTWFIENPRTAGA